MTLKSYLKRDLEQNKRFEQTKKPLTGETITSVAFYQIGIRHQELGNYKKAIECYQKALKVSPGDVDILNSMGLAYGALDDHNKEIECYQKALEVDPENADTWFNLGIVYYILADAAADEAFFLKTIECQQKVLEFNPEHTLAYLSMAGCYEKLGNQKKAEECQKKADEFLRMHAT